MEEIRITDEYITLSQLLKLTNLFDSGGHIKVFINEQGVSVNDEMEYRRGRKLYPDDVVQIDDTHTYIVCTQE